MDILKVDEVNKNFGGLEILKGVTFTLSQGERWAIIGPNGAGKTTLMHILSGVLTATSGKITLAGQDVTRLSAYDRLQLGLSRSFQVNSLFPRLTVEENILLALHGNTNFWGQALHKSKLDDPRYQRVQDLMKSVGLWSKRQALITELAYGEQRQMEIVMALASKPKILMLDEPSAGLSTAESSRMVQLVKTVTEGSTLLFTAHDMDVVFGLAEKIMVLYYGKIVVQGTCDEIRCNEKVKEIYLGKSGGKRQSGMGKT
jgi:branched-chain amino acid transport system ATP-binding protein